MCLVCNFKVATKYPLARAATSRRSLQPAGHLLAHRLLIAANLSRCSFSSVALNNDQFIRLLRSSH